jgi:hypothetical protein
VPVRLLLTGRKRGEPEDEIREDFFIHQTLTEAQGADSVLMLVGYLHVDAIGEKLRQMDCSVATNHELFRSEDGGERMITSFGTQSFGTFIWLIEADSSTLSSYKFKLDLSPHHSFSDRFDQSQADAGHRRAPTDCGSRCHTPDSLRICLVRRARPGETLVGIA